MCIPHMPTMKQVKSPDWGFVHSYCLPASPSSFASLHLCHLLLPPPASLHPLPQEAPSPRRLQTQDSDDLSLSGSGRNGSFDDRSEAAGSEAAGGDDRSAGELADTTPERGEERRSGMGEWPATPPPPQTAGGRGSAPPAGARSRGSGGRAYCSTTRWPPTSTWSWSPPPPPPPPPAPSGEPPPLEPGPPGPCRKSDNFVPDILRSEAAGYSPILPVNYSTKEN